MWKQMCPLGSLTVVFAMWGEAHIEMAGRNLNDCEISQLWIVQSIYAKLQSRTQPSTHVKNTVSGNQGHIKSQLQIEMKPLIY